NCSGILIIKLFGGGIYYLAENNSQFGKISKFVSVEIGNYFEAQRDRLRAYDMTRQSDINRHSALLRDLETIIKPPVKNGITAAVGIEVPQSADVFFIAINPLSRNGTIRSHFSVHHVAVLRVLALGVGASLSPFVRERDL